MDRARIVIVLLFSLCGVLVAQVPGKQFAFCVSN